MYCKKNTWNKLFTKYNLEDNDQFNKTLNIILNNVKKTDFFPKENDIFKCFDYFETNETKIVILGQDPYHGINQATGLCFGYNLLNKDIKKLPPSLKNILKELKDDVIDISLNNFDYTLENWAKQGILLLNTALTVIPGQPGSHFKIWNYFTEYIINIVNEKYENIIFVAWGANAYNKLKNIDTNKHYLIVSSHPSPLSYYKKFNNFHEFKGSKPFSKINEILENNNKEKIRW
jgi:uracil-DNA glycosylase